MIITCTRCNSHVDTGDQEPGDIVTCRCGLGIMVPEAPATAGKMGCPSCGAPVDPNLRLCNFCDTRLATVMCPSCFGMVFDGAKHCVHCGGELRAERVVHHGDETEHCCPRCDEHPKLRVEVVSGIPLERCAQCEGLWIERDVVERVYESAEEMPDVEALASGGRSAGPTGDGVFKPEGYIRCPHCDKMMNRHNFGRFSGVIIDICRDHGTWFDADELRRIVEFIKSGGLEKQARREREELREEMRRMRSQQRMDEMRSSLEVRGHNVGVHQTSTRVLGSSGALSISGLLRKLFW